MKTLLSVLSLLLAAGAAQAQCIPDREALLALDHQAFDQDLDGGWRTVANTEGCREAAADLIEEWRARHPDQADTIHTWHEGQVRASIGQTARAIALFRQSYKDEADDPAWNRYVDATIAFLERDREALLAARDALASLSWPANINVVDGMIACFDQPYWEAYGGSCRP